MLRPSGDHEGVMLSRRFDGDAHLVGAVVVADIHLSSGARLDRVDDPLVVAIGHERQLRARHTAEVGLRLMNLVRDRVRDRRAGF